MRVRAIWIAGDQVAELEIEGSVDCRAAVAALESGLREALTPILEQRGAPFPVLVDVSGLVISPHFSNGFGTVMANVREEFSSVMARWGSGMVTRQIVAIESMKVHHAANLFETRSDAIQFLRQVQRGEILASHRSSIPPPKMPSMPPSRHDDDET